MLGSCAPGKDVGEHSDEDTDGVEEGNFDNELAEHARRDVEPAQDLSDVGEPIDIIEVEDSG